MIVRTMFLYNIAPNVPQMIPVQSVPAMTINSCSMLMITSPLAASGSAAIAMEPIAVHVTTGTYNTMGIAAVRTAILVT